jgi:asparagine synthase (glutamine-hydrolysing)
MLYDGFYAGTDHLIPEYWMPKYVDAKDASARTLQIYNNNNTNKKTD